MSEEDGQKPDNSADRSRADTRSGSTGASRWAPLVFGLIGVVLAFGVGRWTGASGATTEETGAQEETKQYTCPMHPDVRSDDPDDTCPICGMDLVPVSEASKDDGSGSDIPSIQLSDRAMEVAKVRTDFVERRRLSRDIRAYGRVEVAEERETDLTAWVRGRIEHLDIRSTGQRIRRGQRIARLYSPKLESVQKELVQALETADSADEESARARSARAAADAARSRLRVLGLRSDQIESIVEDRKVRETVDIRADTSGTVRKRNAFEGEWVDIGDTIASLQGLDTVWIQLELYQRDLQFVEEGTPVTVTLPSRPDLEVDGRIDFIDPVVDPKNGTAQARIVASNADGELRPGSDVRATIEAGIDGDPPPLSVPESAVLWTGERSVVYRYDRSGDEPAFVPNEVELGPKAGDRRVIRKGLSEGDEIAVSGAFQIDAELQIQGGKSMMTGLHPSQRIQETVEVPEGGAEFDPPVDAEQLPDDVWYCPMDGVHWAQPGEGDGECPVCGMNLEHKAPEDSVEVPEGGAEFDPPVDAEQLPDDVWYCPMDGVHWAQPGEGDGECPVCGMNLKHRTTDADEESEGTDGHDHEGHNHGGQQ